jgi:DNA-binding NarL/FixJ family response regulator
MKPIIVIEDEEAVLGLIVRMLGDYGYRAIRGAASIDEARLLADLSPALVICDHVLAKDAQGRPLRTHGEILAVWPGVPALVISGYPPDHPAYVEVAPDVFHARAPQVRCWMLKPILRDRIVLAVKNLIGPPEPEPT